MAWPVFGGMLIELLTLFVVPVVFCSYKELKMNLGLQDRHWIGTGDGPSPQSPPAQHALQPIGDLS